MSQRFWNKVDKSVAAPCWMWTGSLNEDGYGVYNDKRAHRIAYQKEKGRIPRYTELDHLCRVRACVNPDHLEPVPHRVNVQRGRLGEVTRQRQLAKTHCPNGHEYTPENTYTAPKPYEQRKTGRSYTYKPHRPSRHCKECKRAANRRWYRRKRG